MKLDKLIPYPITYSCNGFTDKEAWSVDEEIFYCVAKDGLKLSDDGL